MLYLLLTVMDLDWCPRVHMYTLNLGIYIEAHYISWEVATFYSMHVYTQDISFISNS